MHTILSIISAPFWFFGLIAMLASIFGKVTVDGRPITFNHPFITQMKIYIFIIGLISAVIAYILITI